MKRLALALVAVVAAASLSGCGWIWRTGSGTSTSVYNYGDTHLSYTEVAQVDDSQSTVKNVAGDCVDIDGYHHYGTPMNADNPPAAAKLPNGAYLAQASCLWKAARTATVTPSYTPLQRVIY